ncbi:HEAT repeat domain-containing protein [Actinomadura sp. 21ATH]|uniref:HEAT repeat domain-containing protein n=1 Tax=Actinomadura sp. 21ATH TaxID=1735444 RepID=UPI0035BF6710
MIAGHQVAFFLRELGSPDPGRRAAAAKGLGRVPGHAAELAALTADPAPRVRAAAAQGLGRQGGAAPVEPLLALCRDPDAEVRRRAVNALDRLGATGPAVTAALVRLAGDTALRNRPAVLGRLLRLAAPVPAGALVPLLADPDPVIWSPAGSLLRLLPEADAVLAGLARTAGGEVRRRALHLLARPQAGVPGMGTPDAGSGAYEAAWRRLWEPVPEVADALLAAVEAEHDPEARSVLLRALAAHRVPAAVAPAAAWLADPRCGPAAAAALAGAGTAEAAGLLRRFATGPAAAGLRAAAVRELGAAGGLAEAGLLLRLLDDPAEPVRLGAVAGLGAFFRRFDGGPIERLERWRAGRVPGVPVPPPSDDPAVRDAARRTAGLLAGMLAADPEHAGAYHDALWHVPEVRPLLPALLEDPDGRVRSTALHLAERFGEMDFAGRLRRLDDADAGVRQGAALAFLLLAEERGLAPDERDALRPHLGRALEDTDHYVRTFASRTLARLDGEPAGQRP